MPEPKTDDQEAKPITDAEVNDNSGWDDDVSPSVDDVTSPASDDDKDARPDDDDVGTDTDDIDDTDDADDTDDTDDDTDADDTDGADKGDTDDVGEGDDEPEDYKALYEAEREKRQVAETRVTELSTKVGDQGRELGDARRLVAEMNDDYETRVEDQRRNFLNTYHGMLEHAKQLESSENQDDNLKATEVKVQAEAFRTNYEHTRWNDDMKHAKECEDSFLRGKPELAAVRDKLDAYCEEHGINAVQLRFSVDRMAKIYPALLDRERGRPENIKKIKEELKKSSRASSAKKVNKATPDASTRAQVASKKKPDGWDDIDLGMRDSGMLE